MRGNSTIVSHNCGAHSSTDGGRYQQDDRTKRIGSRGIQIVRGQSRSQSDVRLLRRRVSRYSRRHQDSSVARLKSRRTTRGLVRLTYDRPHYVPIGRREFDLIAITINNELGKPISIRSGQCVTTLHIRRRRLNDRTAATRVATYTNDITIVKKGQR
jgi:hypothetical protein